MKFWIAKDPYYFALNNALFPQVTFENSPQQIEIKLIEDEKD